MTYTLISTVTVGAGGAASIDFNSIPGTYTDLLLVVSVRSTRPAATNDGLFMSINGSGSSTTGSGINSISAYIIAFTPSYIS